jgi:hypothetical protein
VEGAGRCDARGGAGATPPVGVIAGCGQQRFVTGTGRMRWGGCHKEP